MKKLFSFVLFSFLLSIIFFSCNKDDTVSTTGPGTTSGPVTQSFTANPNKFIVANGVTEDIINANITDDINAKNVTDIKLNLNTLDTVTVRNLRFALVHNGVEILVIDSLTNISGFGNISNLILSDSSNNPIMNVNSYPITGIYKPLNPLSGFDNLEASGNWTLRIYNSGSLRSGVIKSWGITLTYMPVAPPTTQIFPTAVGNYWIIEGRDTSGLIYGYDTLKITNTFTYQNKTLYRLFQNDKPNDTMYAINESDGLYIYGWENNVFVSILMWKYPISVGNTYIGGGNGDTVYCTSVNETVTTPSGTHTGCIKYEAHDMGQIRTIFYMKPGIGLIGSDHYQNNALYDYERLFSYHLNK